MARHEQNTQSQIMCVYEKVADSRSGAYEMFFHQIVNDSV